MIKMFTNMDENKVREILKDELRNFIFTDRFVFDKLIQILDARNIQIGLATGTQIGTAAAQKISFHGATPVIQASAISNPSGGDPIDAQARIAIDLILTALKNKGITA